MGYTQLGIEPADIAGLLWRRHAPLGYDVKDRKLVVNAEEARRVVSIYRRYLELKSVHVLNDAAAK